MSKHGAKVEDSLFSPALLRPLSDIGYLKFRGIDEWTIKSPIFQGKILECQIGNFRNVAFPYQEVIGGTYVGAEIRNHQFKRHLRGSLRSSSVWMSNVPAKAKRLVICESAIDCLSYFQIKGDSEDVYISFGGSITQNQLMCIRNIVSDLIIDPSFKIVVAVDSDRSGLEYAAKIRESFPLAVFDYPNEKDYNEDLKNIQSLLPRRHF
jgi:hypothetical protein